MKRIILPVLAGFALMSCGGEKAAEVEAPQVPTVSEAKIIEGFTSVRSKFDNVFNNPADHKAEDLKPLNDSMAYYVEALIGGYPTSEKLPEVLCKAGVSSLNSKDSEHALKYLNFVIDSFPKHDLVPKSMYMVGRVHEVLTQDIEGAKAAYKVLYRTFPNTDWAENAKSSIKQINNPMFLEPLVDDEKDSTETK